MKLFNNVFKIMVFLLPIATSIVLMNDNFFVKPKLEKKVKKLEINIKEYQIKELKYQEILNNSKEVNYELKNKITEKDIIIANNINTILSNKKNINSLKNKEYENLTKIKMLNNVKPIKEPIDSLAVSEQFMRKLKGGQIHVAPFSQK